MAPAMRRRRPPLPSSASLASALPRPHQRLSHSTALQLTYREPRFPRQVCWSAATARGWSFRGKPIGTSEFHPWQDAVGNLLLRWLRPSLTGPIDRVTYRLRLVLAIQIAVFGIVSFLVLSVGRSASVVLSLPELVSHLMLGLALWNNRTAWSTVLPVAAIGVAGMAISESAVVEVLFIFFIIPVVLPFYSSTKDALTTQILVWVMVVGAGTGMVVMAPDRMPWTWFIVQVAAIGVVGSLMVIMRFSILRLVGANQRLENNLAHYRTLYDDGYRVTLIMGASGHVREVHGAAERLFGVEASRVVGRHYTALPESAIGARYLWEAYLRGIHPADRAGTWTRPVGGADSSHSIHLTTVTPQQQALGIALIAELYADARSMADIPEAAGG